MYDTELMDYILQLLSSLVKLTNEVFKLVQTVRNPKKK